MAASAMVKAGRLGNTIADLPVEGCAPEWKSEKAIAIGQYFVASGVYTVFGIGLPIVKGTKYYDYLFNGMEKQGFGKWGTATDPHEIAQMMIAHIDKKRKQLGIDKARERTLVDMADRRKLTA
jgi:carbon-monoxide dehydrogenase catalytic subunit